MKKQIIITVDTTKGAEEFWKQIDDAHKFVKEYKKPTLWQRIKSWF